MVDNATLKNPNGLLPASEKTTELGGEKRTWAASEKPAAGTLTLQAIVDASEAKKKAEEESLTETQDVDVDSTRSSQTRIPQESQTNSYEDVSEETSEVETKEEDARSVANQKQASLQQKEIREKKEKRGLGFGWFIIALIMALLFDGLGFLINFIPILGQVITSLIITPLGVMIIWLMHVFGGAPFNTKAKAVLAVTGIIEFIPIVQILPALTACVLFLKAMPMLEKRALDIAKTVGGKEVGGLVQKQISHPNSAIMNSK